MAVVGDREDPSKATSCPWPSRIAMIVVFVFLVLRRSAAYAGIPPLYGGEITLLIFAAIFLRLATLGRFVANPFGLVTVLYLSLDAGINALNRPEIGFRGRVIGMATCLLAGLPLTRILSPLGAAIGLALAQITMTAYCWIVFGRSVRCGCAA